MTVKIEDILSYVETKASTLVDLVGHVRIVHPGDPVPDFKDYGLRVYFGEDKWSEVVRRKIGPIVSEVYRVNIDLIFNRNLVPRKVFSDTKGISYWQNLLVQTFVNQRNGGLFKDSFWEPAGPMESAQGSVILTGILTVEIENKYN